MLMYNLENLPGFTRYFGKQEFNLQVISFIVHGLLVFNQFSGLSLWKAKYGYLQLLKYSRQRMIKRVNI